MIPAIAHYVDVAPDPYVVVCFHGTPNSFNKTTVHSDRKHHNSSPHDSSASFQNVWSHMIDCLRNSKIEITHWQSLKSHLCSQWAWQIWSLWAGVARSNAEKNITMTEFSVIFGWAIALINGIDVYNSSGRVVWKENIVLINFHQNNSFPCLWSQTGSENTIINYTTVQKFRVTEINYILYSHRKELCQIIFHIITFYCNFDSK